MATEKRLIYADSGKIVAEHFEKHLLVGDSDFLKGYLAGVKALAEGLSGLPTVDAVEVVHGHWIPIPEHETKRCSVCRIVFSDFTLEYYCPHCGAKMDK